MSASNPFQIPTCFQIDLERRRRERFKKTFIAVVAGFVLLMLGLLIEGCVNEHAKAATAGERPAVELAALPTAPAPRVIPVSTAVPAGASLVSPSNSPLSPAPRPAPPVVKENAAAPARHPVTVYEVKAGDTLTQIARTHGVSVRALKAANGLSGDRIVVGDKLKIPAV
jgi:LysM repeat protein